MKEPKLDAELIGVSQNISTIKHLISRVADTELSALVYGETGVGKELVVQNLYQKSNRFGKPFVKVNCAALPDTLLESEMFGYERGAFTGAQRKMHGKFEQSNRGVLFLDEIGDMSLGLQSKLLHVLQDGTFTPLGSEKDVKTDTWVIAATNHDLQQDLLEGKFRQDLYYRLTTITLHIEPLRRRPADIPYLIEYYTQKYALRYNGNQPKKLSQGVLDRLCTYHWPGNVRELQNILKQLMIFGENESNIDNMLSAVNVSNSTVNNQRPSQNSSLFINSLSFNSEQMSDLPSLSLKKIKKRVKAEVDREVIQYVLEKTGWNRTKASQILKISYRALISRIKDLNIHPHQS